MLLLLGSVVTAATAIGLLLQEGIAALAIIPLLANGLPIWLLINTRYGVTDICLIVHLRAISDGRAPVEHPCDPVDEDAAVGAGALARSARSDA